MVIVILSIVPVLILQFYKDAVKQNRLNRWQYGDIALVIVVVHFYF